MSYLFEQWILGEAVPTKAKSLGINPEKPPDMTDPATGATNASDPNNPPPDEGKDIPAVDKPDQDPAADDEQNPEEDQDTGEDAPDDQGGDAPPPADSGGGDDMSGDAGEDAGDGSEGGDEDGGEDTEDNPDDQGGADQPEDELGQAEKELFKDLKPEQIAIKERELRERFQDLYQVVAESIDKLNKITKTTYDANMLDLVLRQLINLKDTILHSITKAFPTRTYVQNKVELQKLATIFNALTNSVRNIYEVRVNKVMQNSKKKPIRGGDLDVYFTQDLGF